MSDLLYALQQLDSRGVGLITDGLKVRGDLVSGGGCLSGISQEWQYAGASGPSVTTLFNRDFIGPNIGDYPTFGSNFSTAARNAHYRLRLAPGMIDTFNPSASGITSFEIAIIQDYTALGTTRRHLGGLWVHEWNILYPTFAWPLPYYFDGMNDWENTDAFANRAAMYNAMNASGVALGGTIEDQSAIDVGNYTGANLGPFIWGFGYTYDPVTHLFNDFYIKSDGTVRFPHTLGGTGFYTPIKPVDPAFHLFVSGKPGSTLTSSESSQNRISNKGLLMYCATPTQIQAIANILMVQNLRLTDCTQPIPTPIYTDSCTDFPSGGYR